MPHVLRRLLTPVFVLPALLVPVGAVSADVSVPAAAAATRAPDTPVLDLERLDAAQAQQMMAAGELTSVQLVQAYLDRIEALNKRGPGLNAVTQLNDAALQEAARTDRERAQGTVRSPAHGLPILLKDLIDVKGMYTSNGNYSLRRSYPAEDAGIVKKLRENGVVVLGKVGLSEYANSFGNQPSGFANLTGQVLNALDADQNPSGSSSGTGAAGAAALSMLTVGTETSGSIISPSAAQGLVGIRPTVGLVPAYGIGPISSSQDTAGPMDRTVANAALNLQVMSGRDAKNEAGYAAVFGDSWQESITRAPEQLPDYLSALDLDFVRGQRIGYNGTFAAGTPAKLAFDALQAAGAVLVERPVVAVGPVPDLPAGYQQHKAIDEYYANLGPDAPINSLAEEVAANAAEEHQALKFGNVRHLSALAADITPGGANETAYRAAMPVRRAAQWAAIDAMMSNQTPDDPSDDFLAILGTVPSGATAGTPQVTIPMGYNATNRRALAVSIHGNRLSERDLIGVAYVIEQGTQLRKPVSEVNPSMYRCADTEPAPAFADRGSCNPGYSELMDLTGHEVPSLGFSLETESVQGLQARMTAGTLSAADLTRAYLARIAFTNADGPAVQAVRAVNTGAVAQAEALDRERATTGARGPLHGIPVLFDDAIDVAGMPTTTGSIALQGSVARDHAAVVARLEAAGAIILGKTNTTELHGVMDPAMPEGYSALGGQVLLPSDTDKTPDGSSAGAAAATAAGLAALTVGLQTSPESAQLLAPAAAAGVVGLKPTVGRVSRNGVLPVARSQDSPGALTRTVFDAALQLQAVAGADASDPATTDAPAVPDYVAGLVPTALAGQRVAVVSDPTPTYASAVTALQSAGATTAVATATPTAPTSIVLSELRRDLDAYLAGRTGSGATSLQEIVERNAASPVEALKYGQRELLAALAVDLSDPAIAAAYEADLAEGRAASAAALDAVLGTGTADPADDADVVMVPSGSTFVALADRAGYPALTVPAGYGTGRAGRNPIGVTFIAAAFAEAELLAAGYAFEQATAVRRAPSWTNPSMWRCVPESTFFTAELCHPGDRLRSFDELFDMVDELVQHGTTSERTAANLLHPLERAEKEAYAGGEVRTIGYLEQFLARVRNQVKGDSADLTARSALTAQAQRLLGYYQGREAAEDAG